jgi:predicted porin
MKKSLLALAALSVLAGAASAQSSVTLYGKLDLSLGKPTGTQDKQEMSNSSRLGFKGVEDLGNGLKGLFTIETRFSPDTGAADANKPFWGGEAWAGLATPYGTVKLGRQYTADFAVQNALDPWGGDTVGSLRDGIAIPRIQNTKAKTTTDAFDASGHLVFAGETRVNNAVTYENAFSGFGVAATVSESPAASAAIAKPQKFVSLAGTYTAGPLYFGLGYENGEAPEQKLVTLGGSYDFGFLKAIVGGSFGKTPNYADVAGNETTKVKSVLVAGVLPVPGVAALSLRGGYGQTTLDGLAGAADAKYKKASLGAVYKLSARTSLYTDYAKTGGVLQIGPKTGYDFGLVHKF